MRYMQVAFGLLLAGCAAFKTPAPELIELPDGNSSLLLRDMSWQVGGKVLTVPTGFYTDYASVPVGVRALIPKHGRYSRAAIIHDYLYWSQLCTRKQADNILLIAMKEDGVPYLTRGAIYQGVRLGGASSWEGNARERNEGLPRVVPADKIRLAANHGDFRAYRQILKAAEVKDPIFHSASYCDVGNTTEIPDPV